MQKLGRKSITIPIHNPYGLNVELHLNKNYGIHRVLVKDNPEMSSSLTSRMQGRQGNSQLTIDHLNFRIGQLV